MARWPAAVVLVVFMSTACAGSSVQHNAAATPTYVPWLALKSSGVFIPPPSPSPAPPFPIPAGTPACTASHVQGEMGRPSAATGNVDMPILFRNDGTGACVLEGFADVTVLDTNGRVLARAAGSTGKGTYFDDGPDVPILVRPGAQAFMNLTWYDCAHPQAAQLAVDLPGNAGRVMVKFPVAGNYYMLCDTDPHYAALSRGPFSPMGIQWPPGPHYIATTVAFKVPAQVKAGSTLTYFVTVSNTDTVDYQLSPCPDYVEIIGPKQAVGVYGLNCAPVGHIGPGKSVTFEMRLAVPKTVPAGPTDLTWSLSDGRAAVPHGTTALRIT